MRQRAETSGAQEVCAPIQASEVRVFETASMSSSSLRSTTSYAIAQVDYSGAETARLKELEIPS